MKYYDLSAVLFFTDVIYKAFSGNIRRIDEVYRQFIFTDKTVIDMDRVSNIDGDIFAVLENGQDI